MTRPLSFAPLLVVIVISAVPAHGQSSFNEWLGPQSNEKATLVAPVVGQAIDPAKHDKLSRYDITLEIVKGADLKLPVSVNPVVTFGEREFQQTKEFRADKDATYIPAKMQLKKHELGWRFYTLNVRVKDGKLRGAVVHFRDGKIQESIADPCIAVYRIPDNVEVMAGKIPFDVVALFTK